MVTGYLVTGYWLLITVSIVVHWMQVNYWRPGNVLVTIPG
jgi:hypothetical protein